VQGQFYKGKGTLYNINVEAAVISEQIAGRRAAASSEVKSCQKAGLRL
jgi:hypothetical protein